MDYSYSGDEFHTDVRRVYFGTVGAAVFKKSGLMAQVRYPVLHANPDYTGVKGGGGGGAVSRWIFSEDGGWAEGLSQCGLNLMIDFTMEPGAMMGYHAHMDKEEFYYILEGSIKLTTVDKDGLEYTEVLSAGDAHMVRLGQGHYGLAGPEGVRIITVCVKLINS